MSKLILQHPNTGIIKSAPVGFSWTTLFFNWFPALLRGDFKWFIIQLLLSPFLLPQLIFAFTYNKIYLQRMLEKGYKVKSTGGASISTLNAKLGMELPLLSPR